MTQPVVLVSHEMLKPTLGILEAQGWRIVPRWTMTDEDRQAVQAIIHVGEFTLEPELLGSMPKLGLIANVSAGYDGIDVAWCRTNGIEVTHAKGTNAEDVADHAMGLLIAGWRNIVTGDRTVRAGAWSLSERGARPPPGLGGRKLGIVGLGAIGEAVARRAEAFRMQVSWWGPNAKPASWPRADSVLALAHDSEILMVAARADAGSRGLISRAVIEAVGPQGMIVNVSRGSVIDEDALVASLRDGRLGKAALDVFAEEPTPAARWTDLPQVVVTPHMAGGTTDSIPRMVGQAVENIRLFLAGEPVMSPAI